MKQLHPWVAGDASLVQAHCNDIASGLVPDLKRGTGRTTANILAAISGAIRNPRIPFAVAWHADEQLTYAAMREVRNRTVNIVIALGLREMGVSIQQAAGVGFPWRVVIVCGRDISCPGKFDWILGS